MPIEQIEPNPNNHRQNYAGPEWTAFLASVREQGVLQPVLVRPKPGYSDPQKYILEAGERRWRASKQLRLATVPAVISTRDVAASQVATIAENLHREDLTPLEQGLDCEALLKLGMNAAAAAKLLGWSPAMFSRRARLVKLSEEWRKALADAKNGVADWNASMLELVAALPEEVQNRLLQEGRYVRDAAQLRQVIDQNYHRSLKSAPWDLQTFTLPRVGPCQSCPKRTGAQPELFDGGQPKDDECLDGACYKAKEAAWLKQRVQDARETNAAVPLVATDYTTPELRQALGGAEVRAPHQYERAKKNTPGAVKALVVHGPGLGREILIALPRKASGGGVPKAAKPDPAALVNARFIKQVGDHLRKLSRADLPNLDAAAGGRLLAIAAEFVGSYRKYEPATRWAAIAKMTEKEARLRLWDAVREAMTEGLYGPPAECLEFARATVRELKLPLTPPTPQEYVKKLTPAAKSAAKPAAKKVARQAAKAAKKKPATKLVTQKDADGNTRFARRKRAQKAKRH